MFNGNLDKVFNWIVYRHFGYALLYAVTAEKI